MKLTITKAARLYGYIIWNNVTNPDMEKLLKNRSNVDVVFNDLPIGNKPVNWKYRRLSIGYRFTRALPETAKFFSLSYKNGTLEVKTLEQ